MRDSNGILASIPSHKVVGDPTDQLPDPATAEDRRYAVLAEVEGMGTVRMFYERRRAKRHKHSHWFWSPVRAEMVDAAP